MLLSGFGICIDVVGCVFLYRMTVRPAQTDVSFNQQMMHDHSDAETQLQEEISSVWNDTGLVKRCSDQAEIKRLRVRERGETERGRAG